MSGDTMSSEESFGLRLYLFLIPSYSKVYGSLGAAVALLLWLYLTGAAILIGGEVNAECECAAVASRLARDDASAVS